MLLDNRDASEVAGDGRDYKAVISQVREGKQLVAAFRHASKRDQGIIALYMARFTYRAIGYHFSLSERAVHDVLKHYGLGRRKGRDGNSSNIP